MKNFRLISSQDNSSRFYAVLFLLCSVLFFNSCKKDDFIPTLDDDNYLSASSADDQEILESLTSAGFSAADLKFRDDFVDYQDDAGWDKAALLKTLRSPVSHEKVPANFPVGTDAEAIADFRQQGIVQGNYFDAVSATKVSALKFYIRSSVNSDCGSDWVTAILKGMEMFNSIANSRIVLTQTFDQTLADIVFGSDADPGMPASHLNIAVTTAAKGGFPSAGTPWKWISINDTFDNYDSKIKTAIHEVGHCIGYRHTDSADGALISNTPVCDINSIMNQGHNTNPSFTTDDAKAIRLYYPVSLLQPANVSATKLSGTEASVSCINNGLDQKPYYWTKWNLYSNTGVLITSCFTVCSVGFTGSNDLRGVKWANLTPGLTYKFSVQGLNFRRDVASPESVKVTVQM